MEKLLIPNRRVQLIGYFQGNVPLDVIKEDTTKIKGMLENSKYNPKTTFSFKESMLKSRKGVLYLDGHALSDKGKLYKVNLDYGHNVPRYCELIVYTCSFYTMYFLVITDANIGEMDKLYIGTGVSWGSDFFWNYIA